MTVCTRLVLLSLSLCSLAAAHECDVTHVVRVRLIDEEQLPQQMLEEAQEEAGWVLRSLCVELIWTRERSLKAIDIRILAVPLTPDVPQQSMGISLVGGNLGLRGAVFLTRIRETQRRFAPDVKMTRILGCVLAHEIGHLLLSSSAHSSDGIMKAEIGGEQAVKAGQRRLTFTSSDRRRFAERHHGITEVELTERR